MSIVPATLPRAFTTQYYRHIALTISGSTHTLYLDGSVVAVNPDGENVLSYSPAIQNMYIGCAGDLSYGFTGLIDDFKVWNRALPLADISAIYFANAPSTEPQPIVYILFTDYTYVSGSSASINSSHNIGSLGNTINLDISININYDNTNNQLIKSRHPSNKLTYPISNIILTSVSSINCGFIRNFGTLYNFTVTWWQYWISTSNATSIYLGFNNGTTAYRLLGTNNADGRNIICFDGNLTGITPTRGTGNFNNYFAESLGTEWVHYAIVCDLPVTGGAGNVTYYQNGNKIVTNPANTASTFAYTNDKFGFNTFLFFQFPNYSLYKLKIYDNALSQSQITALYNEK